MICSRATLASNPSTPLLRTQAFIDGAFIRSLGNQFIDRVNPATGKALASIEACNADDIDRAVQSARRAFEDGRWRNRGPSERKRVLLRFADIIETHREELGLLETLEMGMPIVNSVGLFIPKAANMIRWYAEALDKVYGEVAPTGPSSLAIVSRVPLGVVAAIIPWNIPIYLAAYKIGPALGLGNSVVLKPSERASLSVLRLAELAVEAGLPEGVLNVVPGWGSEAGVALGRHNDVDCLAFTGSSVVAKRYLGYAAESNMKQVFIEGGGKSANIVFDDARDLDEIARQAAWGVFFNQGAICSAGSRLLVQRSIQEPLAQRICKIAQELRVGDPSDPSTQIGAIVDSDHMDHVLEWINAGIKRGATLRCGGTRVHAESGGYFVAPAVFDNVDNSMPIAKEEIFGPVLSIIPFDTPEEAVQLANDSIYGLGAALWTQDINRAVLTASDLNVGQVWINNYDQSDITVPWGGTKQSGNARDKSLHAFGQYSSLKALWIELTTYPTKTRSEE